MIRAEPRESFNGRSERSIVRILNIRDEGRLQTFYTCWSSNAPPRVLWSERNLSEYMNGRKIVLLQNSLNQLKVDQNQGRHSVAIPPRKAILLENIVSPNRERTSF
jgi:hypothetical protein